MSNKNDEKPHALARTDAPPDKPSETREKQGAKKRTHEERFHPSVWQQVRPPKVPRRPVPRDLDAGSYSFGLEALRRYPSLMDTAMLRDSLQDHGAASGVQREMADGRRRPPALHPSQADNIMGASSSAAVPPAPADNVMVAASNAVVPPAAARQVNPAARGRRNRRRVRFQLPTEVVYEQKMKVLRNMR